MSFRTLIFICLFVCDVLCVYACVSQPLSLRAYATQYVCMSARTRVSRIHEISKFVCIDFCFVYRWNMEYY